VAVMEGENLRLVFVGHVDHGKSTLIGRLLYDTDSMSEAKYQEIKQACEALGRDFEFGYVMDHLREERSQGVTIDTAQTFFNTDKRDYTIIDAPGHVEFVKNMITGASQAEAAILIDDVKEGVQEQTRRHAYILSMLGLEQVIVVLNKMDLVDYSREKFEGVKKDLLDFLNSIGVQPSFVIPISAKKGDFVANRTENLPWYDGPTVLEALDTFKRRSAPTNKPLRLPVQDVYKFDGERAAVGRVESGTIRKGDRIVVLPEGKETTIESLVEFGKGPTEAAAGKSIGLTTSEKLFLDRGDVVVHPDNLPTVTDTIEGHLFWMDKEPFKRGERITFKCATQEVMCDVEIREVIDSSTLKKVREDGEKIENRQVANVVIKTAKPVIVENFNDIQELGRFVLERKDTCAGGIITSLG
jgi:sulfate adenylyltransferase large subunit